MTENSNPKLSEIVEQPHLKAISAEKSAKTGLEIVNANPRAVILENMLADKVASGDIDFRNALGTIRDLDMLTYRDPSEDKVSTDIHDNLRLYIFNYGNVMKEPYVKGKLENQYLRQIVQGNLRLPQAIEVTRQMLNIVEAKDYSKMGLKDPERTKKEKTESLSNALYALTDLQTDLITDQIVQSIHPEWDEVRSNIARGKEGDKELEQIWSEERKRVVEWSGLDQELTEIAKTNQKMRSLLERPVYMGDQEQTMSPIDTLANRPAVIEQAKVAA